MEQRNTTVGKNKAPAAHPGPGGGRVYGNLAPKDEAELAESRAESPIRFQGQWEDEETGLYYNRFRYYDPLAGQYLCPDPIGLKGGARPQGYVENPGVWTDPWGLFKKVPGVKVKGKRSIDRAASYEQGIRDAYGSGAGQPASINGLKPDDIINPGTAQAEGMEAKYVDDWNSSVYNPNFEAPWGINTAPDNILTQAQNYSQAFPNGVTYYTNSVDFANYYSGLFQKSGIKNVNFVIAPTR